ncbi:dimethyladenosine transferase 1, mitochondrial [Microplitis demolitor]|uniref:dimethyladenosine transferase 1, mitochondrial n=1 Tax=Microplitis demolitor TaxID=69319 RepID=UPI0004CCE81D|nr:dimethyladenosine transferase 1, mitochondrial [Microplitis demolitor]
MATKKIRLPPLPSVGDLLKLYRLRARKQLAQNFLLDERIINRLVNQVGGIQNSHVLEVGPGPGGLTRSIIKKLPASLTVIEKDRRFKPTLEMLAETLSTVNGKMNIVYDDILRTDLTKVFPEECHRPWDWKSPRAYIIGNLPFNVSTHLIIRWLDLISKRAGPWASGRIKMCLTFQKEVAERLVAQPQFDQRCRLSVMAQAWTTPKLCFTIPGNVFIPKPDVDVGVVTFEPLITPQTEHDFDFFEKVTRHMFSFRQKYSLACARTLFPKDYHEDLAVVMFKLADLDPTTRAFQLTVAEMDRLCTAYKYIIEKHPAVKDYNYRASKKVLTRAWTKKIYVREVEEDEEIEDETASDEENDNYANFCKNSSSRTIEQG